MGKKNASTQTSESARPSGWLLPLIEKRQSRAEARLLSHLALGIGGEKITPQRVARPESDCAPDFLDWFKHISSDAEQFERDLDQLKLNGVKTIIDHFGESSGDEKEKWEGIVDRVVAAGRSGLRLGARQAYRPHDAPNRKLPLEDVFDLFRCNGVFQFLFMLGHEDWAELRSRTFPLLWFLSRHRLATSSQTMFEEGGDAVPSWGAKEPSGSSREDDGSEVIGDLRELLERAAGRMGGEGGELWIPNEPFISSIHLMIVRDLARALLADENQSLLESEAYRKVIWQAFDAILWHETIRGLFVEVHKDKDYASLPIVEPPSPEKYLWLIAEYGYVVLGVERDLRVHEHFRRAMKHESLLYLSRTDYRDHLFHAIDTFLLGWSMFQGDNSPFGHLPRRESHAFGAAMRNWFLASLFHDFGYVMEMIPTSLKLAEEFGTTRADATVRGLRSHWEEGINALHGKLRKEVPLKSRIAPNRIDHGVFSFLHLQGRLQRLDSLGPNPRATDGRPKKWSSEHCRRHKNALVAILKHNLMGEPVHLADEPLSALLILCDELQEWQRFRFNAWDLSRKMISLVNVGRKQNLDARRICESLKIFDCHFDAERVTFGSEETRIVMRYADQNLNLFDPLGRMLRKIYNLERIEGLQKTRLVLEIEIKQLPFLQGRASRTSELDILRDFCLLRETGIDPGLYCVEKTEPQHGRACC